MQFKNNQNKLIILVAFCAVFSLVAVNSYKKSDLKKLTVGLICAIMYIDAGNAYNKKRDTFDFGMLSVFSVCV